MEQVPASVGLGAPVAVDVPRVDPAAEAGVAVIIVTWNRREPVANQLRAVAKQTFGPHRLDVVVVDNASTDGTLEALTREFAPELVVKNAASDAHEPAFEVDPTRAAVGSAPRTNTAGFRSFTIVRNEANFGGCGGFNTGFAFVERFIAGTPLSPRVERPEFVWLVDDDAEAAPTTLAALAAAAASDPRVGLVGSRTVDIADRRTTIESTIYFDTSTGRMGDHPPEGHPVWQSHQAWIRETGGCKGDRAFTGVRDVDVVSACSALARWEAVKRVGFWDWRYFIYCDDADWALRFARAGFRVVLNLDAVVYHTPWLLKLTPARLYYAQRNVVWTVQKAVPRDRLRRVTFRWLGSMLKQSIKCELFRRRTYAEAFRRAALDVARGVPGKYDAPQPPLESAFDAMDRAGLLRRGSRLAVVCNNQDTPDLADRFRAAIVAELIRRGRAADLPEWTYVVRNDIPDPHALGDLLSGRLPPRRVVYSMRKRSRVRRAAGLLLRPPSAVVVFDGYSEFPVLSGGLNVHVDRKDLSRVFIERDSTPGRVVRLARTVAAAVPCTLYALTCRPGSGIAKYG